MQTKIFKTKGNKSLKEDILEASKQIKNGNLVIFPTETVYGIGANALNKKAVAKIFKTKGRPSDNPLIIHISPKTDLKKYVKDISDTEEKLMHTFWPGPMTLILEKQKTIPSITSANLNTVGVRMPKNKTAQMLIEASGVPLAAPSANISGKPSSTNISSLLEDFDQKVPIIIDDGESLHGLESTVIKVNKKDIYILRPGAITKKMIEKVTKFPVIEHTKKDAKASPGTHYRHYAPNAKILLLKNKKEILKNSKKLLAQKESFVVMFWEEEKRSFPKNNFMSIGKKNDFQKYAKVLYSSFRKADRKKAKYILLPQVPEKDLGLALMNRIKKAKG